MENSDRIQTLFQKYLSRENTETELNELLELFAEMDETAFRQLVSFNANSDVDVERAEALSPAIEVLDQSIRAELNKRRHDNMKVVSNGNSYIRYAIAAAIAFIVIGAYFFRSTSTEMDTDNTALVAADIAPGKMGATLTLANGRMIKLSGATNGELAKQAGVTITKTADGQLVYEVKPSNGISTDLGAINTLSTARGETYQIKLPDGTTVWLNAASSIKYAANLLEYGKRKVTLQGEAYFHVAKDRSHPFIVTAGNQEVEVLGTHFNINAYTDEKVVKTTLLEGSVRVAPISADGSAADNVKGRVLKPGQQTTLTDRGIQLTDVNLDEVMAWQKGYFRFYDEDITSIMRKVSRWYNIEVQYSGALPKNGFNARITKYTGIKEVLEKLEKTGDVHFKIEGRKVIVSK